MTVRFFYDSTCDPGIHHAFASAHDPARGTVVVRGEPGTRRSGWAFAQILAQLGKTYQENEHTRAPNDAEGYALAWLAAEDISRLVVVDAPLLGSAVRPLVLAAVGLGIDVVMLGDGMMTAHFRVQLSGLSDHGIEPAGAGTAEAVLTEPAPHEPVPSRTSPSPAIGWVPRAHFMTFRADLLHSLADREAAAADEVYRTEFHEASLHELRDQETAARALHARLASRTSAAEHTVVFRAYQAAAFRQGVLLTADIDKVLDAVAPIARAANLTASEWQRLNASVRPFFPAVAALLASGVPTDQMHTLPAAAVTDDATSVRFDGIDLPVPEDARKALRAQHFAHRWFGHGRDDAFLDDRSGRTLLRDVTGALNTLSRVHGIKLRHASDTAGKEARWWASSWGVSVTPLEATV